MRRRELLKAAVIAPLAPAAALKAAESPTDEWGYTRFLTSSTTLKPGDYQGLSDFHEFVHECEKMAGGWQASWREEYGPLNMETGGVYTIGINRRPLRNGLELSRRALYDNGRACTRDMEKLARTIRNRRITMNDYRRWFITDSPEYRSFRYRGPLEYSVRKVRSRDFKMDIYCGEIWMEPHDEMVRKYPVAGNSSGLSPRSVLLPGRPIFLPPRRY